MNRVQLTSTFESILPEDPLEPNVEQAVYSAVKGDNPCAVFAPMHYEPNYAYPLVVWLHGAGGSERELPEIMCNVSPQNYIGIAFRGTLPAHDLYPVDRKSVV